MRTDRRVPNDATGFTLHPADLAGATRSEVAADLAGASAAGRVVPVSLMSDSGFVARVVVDEALDPREAAEWVGRASGWLDLRDGVLVLEGGFDDRYEEQPDDCQQVPVPAGLYGVDVYTYLNSTNGPACIHRASGVGEESPIAWYRDAHPGRPVPTWFVEAFEEEIGDDDDFDEDEEDDGSRLVDFLVHLTPVDDAVGDLGMPRRGGWIAADAGARVPARCPSGLAATCD